MARLTPIAALLEGLAAGFVGTLAQDLYFALTRKVAPTTPHEAFEPPEVEQTEETTTQTVGRRVAEQLLQRGPLHDKKRAGRIVHYAFGTAWGGVYGLVAGSTSRPWPWSAGLGFGFLVWNASDNVLLPAFRLAAWPQRYPLRVHAYAVGAHFAYGLGLWAAFQALRTRAWLPLFAAAGSLWATRKLPPVIRRPASRALRRAAAIEAALQASRPS